MATESHRPLSVEYLSPKLLKLDPGNPRKHPDRQIRQIAWSIKTFGFVVPALIDRLDKVLAGHGRVLAARTLDLFEIPVIRLESLTEAQARAFSIADNRLTENSTWDDRLLGQIFVDLSALELDFDLEVTGFSMGEIDLRIEGLSALAECDQDPADQLPDNPDQPPVTVRGDVWLLDAHRIVCDDAREGAPHEVLMQGKLAQVVFTDAPYNVRILGHVSGNGRIQHREFPMASGEMTPGQFTHFLATVMHLLVRHSVDGSIHFHCMDWAHAFEILTAGNQAYTQLKNICCWCKTNAGLGSFYRSQHELVFVFKNGTAPHRNNVQLGKFGRNRTNVWTYPGANSFGRQGEEGKLLELHPTVKPVALVADALLDCSARGDIVLDSFLGSGSTLIAAERVGRVCHALELDPLYVDTAIRRWEKFTGENAIHAATGETFNERAARVGASHG